MPISDFDESYLNKTPNKTPRRGYPLPTTIVWHETASPNADNPHGTLAYNLNPQVQSSYHYLIARNGTIFHYIDERKFIAWHAGVKSAAWGYAGWDVNVQSIGVEVDGPNDGTAWSDFQSLACIDLIGYFKETFGIPMDRSVHLGHKEVAPGYKTDPKGYNLDYLLRAAREQELFTVHALQDVPDGLAPVDGPFYESWEQSGGIWRPGTLTPGYALESPFLYQERLYQRFERGIARRKEDGQIEWLLDGEKDELLKNRALPVS